MVVTPNSKNHHHPANQKSTIVKTSSVKDAEPKVEKAKTKAKLKSDEQRSIGSQGSTMLDTTLSEGTSDPVEFLQKRGYHVQRVIAKGGFSVVYHARAVRGNDADTETDQSVDGTHYELAIKTFDLRDPAQSVWIERCLKREMFICRLLKHPNVVQTFDVIKTHSYGFIVMDMAPNGSIGTDLAERLKRPYTNDEAHRYFHGLMCGLEYIHSVNVAHRDLKLDNFLLSSEWVPMIGDFGFAANALKYNSVVLSKMLMQTRCGTEGYMAPEMFKPVKATSSSSTDNRDAYYDAKALDIYSMGICLYEMLNLTKPYAPKMDDHTKEKIINQDIAYFNPKVEPSCKELIGLMVQYSPDKRPSAKEVQKHRWCKHGSLLIHKIHEKIHEKIQHKK